MNEQKEISFDLDPRVITALAEEYSDYKVVVEFANAISGRKTAEVEPLARRIFEPFGEKWMKRSLELGDEYPDHTYDVIKAAAEKTKAIAFPHIPQRALEIAYIGSKGIRLLRIIENSPHRLVYRLNECPTYVALCDRCGQNVANMISCRYACLAACQTLKAELNLEVNVEMEASTNEDGFCQFVMSKVIRTISTGIK
ncbi:hypothetical protein ACFLWX_03110 [Chloroflexota bacterium]